MSDNPFIPEDLLKELAMPPQRLMYGEWLPDMCSDCTTLENVHRYTDRTHRMKQTVYLCDSCFASYPAPLAEKFTCDDEPGETA